MNSSWSANPTPIKRCTSGSLIWGELVPTRTADGKLLYRNAFATSLAVNDANVAAVVASGRARWKIENENNNTLKTKGYHFEHHYGHGGQYLSSLLATPVMLVHLLHTLLDLMDDTTACFVKYCLHANVCLRI